MKASAQKDGTIHRRTSGDNGFVTDASDWVLSGPHFFLANPFNKTPRRVCTANGHYDPIDLEVIPDDYLPRTNYHPMADRVEYLRRIPRVSWVEPGETSSRPVTEYFRHIHRRMISISMDRTTIGGTHATEELRILTVDFRLLSKSRFLWLLSPQAWPQSYLIFSLKQREKPICAAI